MGIDCWQSSRVMSLFAICFLLNGLRFQFAFYKTDHQDSGRIFSFSSRRSRWFFWFFGDRRKGLVNIRLRFFLEWPSSKCRRIPQWKTGCFIEGRSDLNGSTHTSWDGCSGMIMAVTRTERPVPKGAMVELGRWEERTAWPTLSWSTNFARFENDDRLNSRP